MSQVATSYRDTAYVNFVAGYIPYVMILNTSRFFYTCCMYVLFQSIKWKNWSSFMLFINEGWMYIKTFL